MERRAVLGAGLLLALTLAGALVGTAAAANSARVHDGHANTPHPTSDAMAGMDHGADGGGMAGMDHGADSSDSGADTRQWWPTDGQGHEHGTGSDDVDGTGHGEHGSTGAATPDRPLGRVLGGFSAGSAVVLGAAALMRRRDRSAAAAKKSHLDDRAALS